VLHFDVDRARVIEEEEILSTLDQRQNIMDLTWGAFETLIKDLFNRMHFDTYRTRPSRDGGVDCFAYLQDERVKGIKVVIQAKQWSKRIPVEAVRDLAGTVDNERAAKGILITTSDFTTGGEKFAQENGRLQLINGERTAIPNRNIY
jgi:restriction system protein